MKIAVTLLALSAIDASLTHAGLYMGHIEEWNPFARGLYNWSILAFFSWKLLLPALLIMLYPRVQSQIVVRQALYGALAIYLAVTVYHIFWICQII